MNVLPGLCFAAFSMMMCAAEAAVPLACNLRAISPAERPRYNQLVNRLRASVKERSEVPDGYKYRLDEKAITLQEAAEWITMERLCCPFLSFQFDIAGKGDPSLTLRGPRGAKAIMEAEFPAGK